MQLILLLVLAAAQSRDFPEQQPEPAVETPRRAEANTKKDFVRMAFNFYDQSDGGGNPHLDEDMTVLEPQILWSKSLSDRWVGTAKLQSDAISAASVESGKRFPSGTQSGASGDKFIGGEVGAFYAWSDRTTVGGGLSGSTEYDYQSFGGFVKGTYETPTKNDAWSARVSTYLDTLDIILFNGMEEGTDSRDSISMGLGWTHVLGPETVGTLNWDLTRQSGFLSTPYGSVVAAGTEVREVLPDTRMRNALHARVRHLLLDDLAVEPGAGVYFDDWGSTAFNLELALFWEAFPSTLIVRPNYRFHDQTEVDDFLPDTATTIPEFRTQDSDLADLSSHTYGVKLIFPHAGFMGKDHEFEIGVEFTSRSDDLDALSFTVGNLWGF